MIDLNSATQITINLNVSNSICDINGYFNWVYSF